MIKWKSNFSIDDSTVQLAEVIVKIKSYKNSSASSTVVFNMVDTSQVLIEDKMVDVIIKTYERTFERTFTNENEIYDVEILNYTDAELV